MTLDPSLYRNHAAQERADMAVPYTPAGTRKYIDDRVDLGDRIRIFYSDGTTEDVPKGRLASEAGSGAGNALGYAQLSASQANQQAQLAESQRQFDEQMGMDKAKFNIQQQYTDARAAEAQANRNQDFGAAQYWKQRADDLDRQRFGLDQRTELFNEYNKLAELASNPRNFVQNFFTHRGYSAPPDVARYGNTTQTAADITPLEQFLQRFQGPGASSSPAAPASSSSVGYQGLSYATGRGNAYSGLNHFNVGGPITLAQNDPDAQRLIAQHPGMYQMGPNYGLPAANYAAQPPSPAATQSTAGGGALSAEGQQQAQSVPNPSDWLKGQMKPKMYGRGGSLTMMVPHALVNLVTGRVAAIAGERGKETARFDGAALIDPIGGSTFYDTEGSGASPIPMLPDTSTDPGVYAPPYDPYAGSPNYVAQPGLPPAPSPLPTGQPLVPQSFQLSPEQQAYIAQQNAAAAAYNAVQPVPGKSTTTQTTTTGGGASNAGATTTPPPTTTDLVTPGTTGGPVSYGQPVPAQMPTYLAGENFQAASPMLAQMQQAGIIPPFLRRLWAQARGDASQGTNAPMRTDLPPDLPLMSRIAWNQLNPSERDAFLSIVSSLGVSPEDYLNLIDQFSPSGGSAYSPSFGNAFRYTPQ